MARNIKVIKNEHEPETPEVLASSLIAIAKGLEKLTNTPLTENAIVVLLKGMPGMSYTSSKEVRLVLQNLKKLTSYYIRKDFRGGEK